MSKITASAWGAMSPLEKHKYLKGYVPVIKSQVGIPADSVVGDGCQGVRMYQVQSGGVTISHWKECPWAALDQAKETIEAWLEGVVI
jgi:hypothetical protein